MFEILVAVGITGIVILYIILHPIKTVKWIAIAVGVLAVGTLGWAGVWALVMSL